MDFDVTRCPFAEFFRTLGEPELAVPPKSFARAYEKDRVGLLAAIKAGSDPSNN